MFQEPAISSKVEGIYNKSKKEAYIKDTSEWESKQKNWEQNDKKYITYCIPLYCQSGHKTQGYRNLQPAAQ